MLPGDGSSFGPNRPPRLGWSILSMRLGGLVMVWPLLLSVKISAAELVVLVRAWDRTAMVW